MDWFRPARLASRMSTEPKYSGSCWISFMISLYWLITLERACRFPDGAGHIADQAQLAAQVVAGVAAGVHHLGQVPDGVLPIGVEYPAQTGPQQAVHLRVQVVQAVRDLQNRLACIFHGACPPYRKKIRVSRMKMGMRHRRAQKHISEEGGHVDAVFIGDGLDHEVGGVADIGSLAPIKTAPQEMADSILAGTTPRGGGQAGGGPLGAGGGEEHR